MFNNFSKRNNQNQKTDLGQFDERMNYNQNQYNNPNMSSLYPNFQYERIQYEIKENRRRINNLAKRIIRIENYLRIRDTSDYSINEDDDPNGFPL